MPHPLLRFLRSTRMYGPLRAAYHRAFFRRRIVAASCSGIIRLFSTPTPTIAEHVVDLTGEGPVLEAWLAGIRPGDVVWDVGAGFGLYSLFASARLSGGTVIAFEPEAGIRSLLLRNIALNNAGSIIVFPIALAGTDGEAGLHASDSPNVGTSSFVLRTDYRVRRRPVAVRTRRGDTLIAQGEAPHPTVLKLDVEGAELLVLTGLADTLRSGAVRVLCCEVHPRLLPLFGASADQVDMLLALSGFTVALRHERGTEYHLLCTRRQ